MIYAEYLQKCSTQGLQTSQDNGPIRADDPLIVQWGRHTLFPGKKKYLLVVHIFAQIFSKLFAADLLNVGKDY